MDLSNEGLEKLNKRLVSLVVIILLTWTGVKAYNEENKVEGKSDYLLSREVVDFTYNISEGDYQFSKVGNDIAYIWDKGGTTPLFGFEFQERANMQSRDLNLKKTPFIDYKGDYSLMTYGVEKTRVLFDVHTNKLTKEKEYSNPQVLDIYYDELEMVFTSGDKKSTYKLHEQFDDKNVKPIYVNISIYKNEEGKHAFGFLGRPKFVLSNEYIDEVSGNPDYSNIYLPDEKNNEKALRYICIEDEGCHLLEEAITEADYLANLGFKTETLYFKDPFSAFIQDFNYRGEIGRLLYGINIQQREDNVIEFVGTKEAFSKYDFFQKYIEDFDTFKDYATVSILIDGGSDPFAKLLEIFKTVPNSLSNNRIFTQDFFEFKACEESNYRIDSFEKLESFYYEQQKCLVDKKG